MNISDMVAKNGRTYPNEIAFIELAPSRKTRKIITWQEFDQRVNKFANALVAIDIKRDDKVIHWMMNSINWLEAYFGIIRSGAWAVPLNFRFTSDDLKYCVDVAEPKAMVFSEEFTERVETVQSQLPIIKEYIFVGQSVPKGMKRFEDVISGSSPQPTAVMLGGEDGCGLYFTSGTTGAPKPILLTHKNLESGAISQNQELRQLHGDNFLMLQPLYHTGGMIHWLGGLIVGARATLVMERITPQLIFQTINDEEPTLLMLLVPWIQDILTALDSGLLKKEDYDFSSLRLMFSGAQPVPPNLIKRWKQYFPTIQYCTAYGLTEATGPGCVHLDIEDKSKVGSIGRTGFNWEARIVNDKGEDVAQGEIGELVVKGDGVMKEYYKNPQKTSETIVKGWLYTGDMVKMDDEGFIYLVDRKKDIIIYGGENIYPVEVENILRNHPKIYDVAVIGIPDERLGELPVAVIDPNPGVTLTEAEINEFCERNLPRYKRPKGIIFDKVPRNPTGKIEKPKIRQNITGRRESFRI
jgi:acyl-CoA synthetase (AMP-forming)/AMP-acid ligase II